MSKYNQKVHELTDSLLRDDYEKRKFVYSGSIDKSIPCSMVLRLMDSWRKEFCNNYCSSLDLVLELFPEIDRAKLEKELDKYV